MLLRHLGEREAAQRVENAVRAALAQRANHTRDLGGSAGTDSFTRAVIAQLA
jgi:isocitrate/isopropylmalate dehydrogenase